MNQFLIDVLKKREPVYIYSFFNLDEHTTQQDIQNRLDALSQAGIRTIVLEYGNGLGGGLSGFTEHWFELLQQIINLLKERNMTFLIQDAAPFPTGAANGWFEKEPFRKYRKLFIAENHMDVEGPRPGCTFLADDFLNAPIYTAIPPMPQDHEDQLLHVIAMQKSEDGAYILPDTAIDITANIEGKFLRWDVPAGRFRLFFIFSTRNGGRLNYASLMDRESVKVLIESTHELHFKHIGEEAGKTWLGFFYDEPEIGNTPGYDFDAKVGEKLMALPWNNELVEELEAAFGPDYACMLPLLWYNNFSVSSANEEKTRNFRYTYMDILTKLIEKNYNGQVYAWCRDHGLLYIGHVLEDENSHTRLGCGPGHFFRIEHYQDMAGIDVIGAQLMPGQDYNHSVTASVWDSDGTFFHYGIGKLASSLAHINPYMKGQSFCEILALYGMTAGPKYRKFITDHLLVSGINHFIIMQGSCKGNPDFPYGNALYAPYFAMYTDYMNRMCHLVSSGIHQAPAAILYHGESEWAGKYEPFQRPAALCAQMQIDYDIMPCDILAGTNESLWPSAVIKNGRLCVHNTAYKVLIVPGCQFLPYAVIQALIRFSDEGFPVIFYEHRPVGSCEGISDPDLYIKLEKCGHLVRRDELKDLLEKIHIADITCDSWEHYLRYMYIKSSDGSAFIMLHNQKSFQPMDPMITLPDSWTQSDKLFQIDLLRNEIWKPKYIREHNGPKLSVKLHLEQWESTVLYYGHIEQDFNTEGNTHFLAQNTKTECAIYGSWTLDFHPFDSQINYGPQTVENAVDEPLKDISLIEPYIDFSGEISYKLNFSKSIISAIDLYRPAVLEITSVFECVRVILNNRQLGYTIAPPYRFTIPGDLLKENNHLEIQVQTSLARGLSDGFIKTSKFMPLEPSGITGKVFIKQ